jgi:WD40 repeat protein
MNELSDKLSETYSREELKVLCFELGLDPEELEQSTKSEFVWEIATWCQRRGRMAELIALCRAKRPHISWPDPPAVTGASDTGAPAAKDPVRRQRWTDRSQRWALVAAGLITLFLCAAAAISLVNGFAPGATPAGRAETTVSGSSSRDVETGPVRGNEVVEQPATPAAGTDTNVTPDFWPAASGFEEMHILGHGDTVNSVTWSPDGRQLATGSNEGQIRIWDAVSGQLLRSLSSDRQRTGSRSWINSVAWSPAGDLLLSADDAIHLWDVATGAEVRVLDEVVGGIEAVRWSPDGTRFAWGNIATGKGSVSIWDLSTMRQQTTLSGHGDWVSDFAWSPDGTLLASGGENNMVHLWDDRTGAERYIFSRHTATVNDLAWSPDGAMVATVSQDGTLRIVEAGTGQQIRLFELSDVVAIESVDWSPDMGWLALGGSLGISASGNREYLWIFDGAKGATLSVLAGHTKGVTDVAWSPDGTMLASASLDSTVRIWRLAVNE